MQGQIHHRDTKRHREDFKGFLRVLRVSVVTSCLLLVLAGCTDTPETRVERSEKEITRALANAKRLVDELAKSEAAIVAERAKLTALIEKLNGLMRVSPVPSPTPVPAPSPGPAPVPPGPQPPVPRPSPAPPTEPDDGRFAIAKAVYRSAMAVNSPDRVAEAQALAAVFASVSAQIAAGTLNGTLLDPQWHKISVALTAGNKPVMAKHLSAWKSSAEELSEAIASRYSDDKLKNNQDWADLLSEISIGLKAVK